MSKVTFDGEFRFSFPAYTEIIYSSQEVEYQWNVRYEEDSSFYSDQSLIYKGNFSRDANGTISGEITDIEHSSDEYYGQSGELPRYGSIAFSEAIHVDDLTALQKSGDAGVKLLMRRGDDIYVGTEGYGGNDTFHPYNTFFLRQFFGGSGYDKVAWDLSDSYVRFDLRYDQAKFVSIEAFVGSRFPDILRGASGNDRFDGASGKDRIYGYIGNDRIAGGNGHDQLWGGSGNDSLYGGNGNDALTGDGGRDILSGGIGNDKLFGGRGLDTLDGGRGRDLFMFKHAPESSGKDVDHIVHFNQAEDLIDLKGIDADIHENKDQAFDWIGISAFSGEEGQLRYSFAAKATLIEGDINGDRKADFQLFIDHRVTLTELDFAL